MIDDGELAEVRETWPTIQLEESLFLAYAAERMEGDSIDHLADLYLACACAHGDGAALDAFDQRLMPEVARVLNRYRLGEDTVEELKQTVRERLFVADESARIRAYTGAGSLAAWVRTMAARIALDSLGTDRRRKAREQVAMDAMLAEAGPSAEDLEHLKQTYAQELRTAFDEAIHGLPPEDRALLRFHHVDALSTRRIAGLQQVHSVTVLRRLGAARDRLLGEISTRLRDRLDASNIEPDSILQLARSELQLSLGRMLAG